MAEEKKVTTAPSAEKPADKAPTTATTGTAAKKAPAKKAAAKKAPAKKAPAKKAAAKKTTAKAAPAAKKAPAKKEITLDTITTKLWKKFEKANVSKVQESVIAIQVVIENMGTFFIALKDGEKQIIQAVYDDRDGTLECALEEATAIIAGGYDYLANIKAGKIRYYGDLKKAAILADLLK